MICVFGVTMAIFACIWNVIGIDLGWLFLTMGLIIGGAVFPVAFAVTWRGQSKAGALAGSLSGLSAGIIAWLVTAKTYYGAVTVETTGKEYPTLAGNLAAVMTGMIVSVAVSLVKPQNFDWDVTRAINPAGSTIVEIKAEEEEYDEREAPSIETSSKEGEKPTAKDDTLPDAITTNKTTHTIPSPLKSHPNTTPTPTTLDQTIESGDSPQSLHRAFILACWASFLLTFAMDFLIPMPMFFAQYVFSKGFFTAWVVISFLWVFVSTGISVVLPLVEARGFFAGLARDIGRDLGRGRK